ncbi:MAG: tRNA (N6-threonylcarbamoyladenosine(37)-N6)-methyltransferase TrmO [Candidatus Kapabacteria bacterium]|nr:tRNA (N6-threonylcarbamoyladenosine(37)-N6)-methyltransferase TrmO [Candidatus Kapabacteria bacterium]
MVASPISLTPIGIVHTQYVNKYDAPRQPRVDNRVDDACVELYPHCNYEQALRDVDGCDRIWLVTFFDRALGWKPLVLTPRDRTKRGVFATRSPHRPNAIGITCVEVVRLYGRRIDVRGTDLLDGTPVLDIKPYVAYADAFPESRVRWLDELPTKPMYMVVWSKPESDLPQDVKDHADRVLSTDPMPHPYRRIEAGLDGTFVLAVREHRLMFVIEGQTVTIL